MHLLAQHLLTILRIMEAIACIAGFLAWKKIKDSYWKWFPVYLAFIVVSEFIGNYTQVHHLEHLNKAYFNYFEIPIEFLFFFWIFHMAFRRIIYSHLPMICTCIYIACWLADIFYLRIYFNQSKFWFDSFSNTMGNLLLLILILRYFTELVSSDAILHFKSDMLFWVSTGLLIFYLGTFPFFGLYNILARVDQEFFLTYKYIMYVLNCIMYLSFTFSFIWGRSTNTKYS